MKNRLANFHRLALVILLLFILGLGLFGTATPQFCESFLAGSWVAHGRIPYQDFLSLNLSPLLLYSYPLSWRSFQILSLALVLFLIAANLAALKTLGADRKAQIKSGLLALPLLLFFLPQASFTLAPLLAILLLVALSYQEKEKSYHVLIAFLLAFICHIYNYLFEFIAIQVLLVFCGLSPFRKTLTTGSALYLALNILSLFFISNAQREILYHQVLPLVLANLTTFSQAHVLPHTSPDLSLFFYFILTLGAIAFHFRSAPLYLLATIFGLLVFVLKMSGETLHLSLALWGACALAFYLLRRLKVEPTILLALAALRIFLFWQALPARMMPVARSSKTLLLSLCPAVEGGTLYGGIRPTGYLEGSRILRLLQEKSQEGLSDDLLKIRNHITAQLTEDLRNCDEIVMDQDLLAFFKNNRMEGDLNSQFALKQTLKDKESDLLIYERKY